MASNWLALGTIEIINEAATITTARPACHLTLERTKRRLDLHCQDERKELIWQLYVLSRTFQVYLQPARPLAGLLLFLTLALLRSLSRLILLSWRNVKQTLPSP